MGEGSEAHVMQLSICLCISGAGCRPPGSVFSWSSEGGSPEKGVAMSH